MATAAGGSFFLFSKRSLEILERNSEREFNSAFAPFGHAHNDLGQHLVEGGSKIVENSPTRTESDAESCLSVENAKPLRRSQDLRGKRFHRVLL